jgi:putative chitinase
MIDWRMAQINLGAFYEGKIDGAPGQMTYAGIFAYAAGKMSDAARELGAAAVVAFPKYGCTSSQRIAFGVAEGAHETGNYTKFEEDLSHYTAQNVLNNWGPGHGGRVKNAAEALALVQAGQEALANKVYQRPEYGNVHPGDGWKYRGRGINMQTFEVNYAAAEAHTGVPFVEHPDLMAQPGPSLTVACYYWQSRGCWGFADRNDPPGWRHLTNGGTIGLDDFTKRTVKLRGLFS